MSIFSRRRQRRENSRECATNDRLRKLDAVSPTNTLEVWWSHVKDQGHVSQAARETCECDDHGFTW